jgi:uncharacterized membrane protein
MAAPDMAPAGHASRRGYLDWLRGLAVLIMIEAHVLDAWTRLDERGYLLYRIAMIVAGFGAPLFLFLAGVSVSLSAGSKLRRGANVRKASSAVVRRGLEIYGLAFLFRLQAWAISWGSIRSLLKVDILNIMGPGIMMAAALWGVFQTTRARAIALVVAALTMSLLTPPVRAMEILGILPDAIEGYLRPRPGYTNFCFFPWAGFVFAGAFVGVLLDQARTRPAETAMNLRFAAGGLLLGVIAYTASFMPSPYAYSEFWTSSPSFFLLRTGVLVAVVGVAYAGVRSVAGTFSPMQQLGRTSLFIYWIHVEMIYGLMARPLHKSLSFGQAAAAFCAFAVFMLVCSLLKDRVVAWWRGRSRSRISAVQSAGTR